MLTLLDARLGRRPSGIGQYLLSLCREVGDTRPDLLRPVCHPQHLLRFRRAGLRPVVRRDDLRVASLPPADVFHGPNFHAPSQAARRAVATIHDLAFLTMPEAHPPGMPELLDGLIRASLAWTDRFVCVSEDTKRDFVTTYGVQDDRCDVIPHGVDAERFHPGAGSGGEAPYLLFVGAMVPRKNLPALLRAFDLVAPAAPDLRLVVAGHKTKRWASDWPFVKQWLGSSANASRVDVLNYVRADRLPGLYRSAAAVVLPSLTEGFGMTVLEAFASGVPVVCSDRGALPEVGADVAFYCDPQAPETIAEAILHALDDGPRRRDAGLAIAREHSWARTAALHLESYARAAADA